MLTLATRVSDWSAIGYFGRSINLAAKPGDMKVFYYQKGRK